MPTQRYEVTQPHIDTLLAWVASGEIAFPEGTGVRLAGHRRPRSAGFAAAWVAGSGRGEPIPLRGAQC